MWKVDHYDTNMTAACFQVLHRAARSHYGGVRKVASGVASSSAWVTDCCSALVAEEVRAEADWLRRVRKWALRERQSGGGEIGGEDGLSSSGQSLVRICPVSYRTAEWRRAQCASLQSATAPTSAIWAVQPCSISSGEMGVRAGRGLVLTALPQHCHRACPAQHQLPAAGLWTASSHLTQQWP
ncbi:hypothetical protein SRHO_G00226940 [Serrasalmus rhombeus]